MSLSEHKRGFTIIELLVVCSIIAVLATVVVMNYKNSKITVRNAKRVQDLSDVRSALDLYKESNGSYPLTTAGSPPSGAGSMRSECNGWGPFTIENVIPGLIPSYLSSLPKDALFSTQPTGAGYIPNNDDKYCYIYTSNSTDYAFMLHYANSGSVTSEVNWLSRPELVDPARSCGGQSGSTFTACHSASSCNDGSWTIPTNNAQIHAWKIYSEGGKCW